MVELKVVDVGKMAAVALLDLVDEILLASGWVQDDKGFYPRHWESTLMDEYGVEPDSWVLAHYSRENAMRYEIRFRQWQVTAKQVEDME